MSSSLLRYYKTIKAATMEFVTLPNFLILAGGLLSILGGFLASRQAQQEQDRFAEKLEQKNSEIISITKEKAEILEGMIIGGKSYPWIIASFSADDQISLLVVNNEKSPIYDLRVELTDQKRLELELDSLKSKGAQIPWDVFDQKFKDTYEIGTLGSSQVVPLNVYRIDPKWDHFSIILQSSARNGNFKEFLAYSKVNGKWMKAMQIYGHDKILKEEIPDGFPAEQIKFFIKK